MASIPHFRKLLYFITFSPKKLKFNLNVILIEFLVTFFNINNAESKPNIIVNSQKIMSSRYKLGFLCHGNRKKYAKIYITGDNLCN